MTLLRDIAKKIFPRMLLKHTFLVFNSWKSKTWDKVLFKKEPLSINQFVIYEEMNPFLASTVDTSRFDSAIKDKLTIWEDPGWMQDQYLLIYKQVGFIESKVGWGITLDKKLIYASLGFASALHVHKPDFIELYFRRNVVMLDKVISLRDTGEENYFHFFNDVLAKLFFLEEQGIQFDQYTIIISNRLYQKHYFQHYLSRGFNKFKWHVQKEHEWVQFNEAIFCKPFTHTKRYLDKMVKMAPSTNRYSERRLFLTRSTSSLRYIQNISELKPILGQFKFEIVDCAQLSFIEQVTLFSQCRYLVAIHGAGITNAIFRSGQPMSLLEIIHPFPYIPFHYIMLSELYNYEYDVLQGHSGEESGKGGFVVNKDEFGRKLSQLFQNQQ